MKCKWKRLVAICMAGIMMSSSACELALSVKASEITEIEAAAIETTTEAEISEEEVEVITEETETIVLEDAEPDEVIVEQETAVTENTEELADAVETVTETVEDNYCGNTVTWTLADGVLTISGTGEMFDYAKASETPWYANATEITSVVIEDGVTTVAAYGFRELTALESVVIGAAVTTIGKYAFYKDTAIKELTLPNQACNSIGTQAFGNVNPVKIKIREDAASISRAFLDYTNTVAFEMIEPSAEGAVGNFEVVDGILLKNEDTGKKLVRYPAAKTDLTEYTVPSDVTVMSDYAFSGTVLKNVELPDGLQNISAYAFNECTALEEIVIPDSVLTIGEYAFNENTALLQAVVGNGVTTIGKNAFYKCSAMTELVLGANVTEIGASAFNGDSAIAEMTVPNQACSSIGGNAFTKVNPTKIKIREDATGISRAFVDYTNIMAFEMVDPAVENAAGSFEVIDGTLLKNEDGGKKLVRYPIGKTDLTEYTVPSDVTVMSDYAFSETVLKNVELPEGLQNISAYAFNECMALEEIVIPDSVLSIGEYAFNENTALLQAVIGNGVTTIGKNAFYKCSAMTELILGANVTEIGASAFNGDSAIAEMTVPNQACSSIGGNAFTKVNPTKIKIREDAMGISRAFVDYTNIMAFEMVDPAVESVSGSFEVVDGILLKNEDGGKKLVRYPIGKTELTEYTVPSDVTVMSDYAFSETALKNVELPEGLQSISAYAFNECTALEEIVIPDSVLTIGEYAFFKNTALKNAVIGKSVTTIGNYAFKGCTSIGSVVIPDSVTYLGYDCFSGATGMKSLVLGDGLPGLESGVFEGCTSLENVVLGSKITYFGKSAFKGDAAIKTITVPNQNCSFHNFVFEDVAPEKIILREDAQDIAVGFLNFESVIAFEMTAPAVENAKGNLKVEDGVLYSADGSQLIRYPSEKSGETYEVLEGTKCIKEEAFASCSSLMEVTIPDSVTAIERMAFYNCTSLEQVVLGTNVETIGTSVFYQTALKRLTLPNTGAEIDYIPRSVTTIQLHADAKGIGIMESVADVFVKEYVVLAPADASAPILYQAVDGVLYTADGKELVAYPGGKEDTSYTVLDGTEIIGAYAFNASYRFKLNESNGNEPNLMEIKFPDTLRTIEERAFESHTGLTSISLPEGVTNIGKAAFNGCQNLEKVYMPESVKNIGDSAFYVYEGVLTFYCAKGSYAEDYAIRKQIPYITSNYHIGYTLNKMYASAEGEEGQCLRDDITNYQVTLLNQTTGKVLTGHTIYDSDINLPLEMVSAGDVIVITLISKNEETLDYQTKVTLDENVSAIVEMEMQEKGYIVTTPETIMETTVLVFDVQGNCLETMLYKNEPCVSDWYEDGEYQLLYIQGPNQYWRFDTLSEFEERGLIENQDYITKKVKVNSGIVTRVEDVIVPEINLELIRYLSEDSVYMAESTTYVNGLLQVRVDYAFTELRKDEVTPEVISITIPKNAKYVENSLTVDGKQIDSEALRVDETHLEIAISNDTGVLRWMFRPYNHQVMSSTAKIQFKTAEQSIMDVIGEIKVEVPTITLSGSSQTSSREVLLYGTAVPGEKIGIYDGAVRIGTATASKAGNWKATVPLNEPQNGSIHKIQARVYMGTSDEVTSNAIEVFYNEEYLEVTEFTVHHNHKYRGKPYNKAKDLLKGRTEKYLNMMLLGTNPYFTFTIKVSDNEAVEKMYVVSTKPILGARKLEAFYNSELDTWIASGRFGSENEPNYVPGDFSVEIVKSEKGFVKDLNYVNEIDGEALKETLVDPHFQDTVNTWDENTDRGVYGGTLVYGAEGESSIKFECSKTDVEAGAYNYEELLEEGFVEIETLDSAYKTLGKLESDANGGIVLRAIQVPILSRVRSANEGFDWSASLAKNSATETIFQIWGQSGVPGGDAVNAFINLPDVATNGDLDKIIEQAEEKLREEYTNGKIKAEEYYQKKQKIDTAKGSAETLRTLRVTANILSIIGPMAAFAGPPGLAASLILWGSGVVSNFCIDFMEYYLQEIIKTQVKFSVDPSGYVYEGVPGNRVEGVTATVYYRETDADGNENAVLWNAEEYDQKNPQITNEIGFYQWFVPEGYWQVKYEKEGYETAYSEWLPVPPPQTEVNIGLVSTEPPTVELVELYEEYATVTFSKYMKADTISADTVKVLTAAGEEVSYELEALNGEVVDGTALATQFKLNFVTTLASGTYTVSVDDSVLNYADLTLEADYKKIHVAKSAIYGLKAEVPETIVMNDEITIPVTIESEGDCSGYTLKAEGSAFAEVVKVSSIKDNVANITVKAKLPGTAVLQISLDGTMIQKNVELNITMEPVEDKEPIDPEEPDKPIDPEEPIVPPVEEKEEIVRLYGSGRYETGYKVADELKEILGVEKFGAVVVATGKNFADALAGSYLAVEKNAPILLTNGKADNVAQLHAYIRANVKSNGTIYILGGEGAVPAIVDAIEGYTVKRLFGSSRYDTNIEILKEAGVNGNSIIVATGKTFADSLSASAAKLPILLVKPNGTLNDVQKSFLKDMKHIYIVGGEGAVGKAYEKELKGYAEVIRVFGSSRYDTSVEVAKTFCKDADLAVVASGKNFPDGLCGGPLAAALNAPLVLTKDKGTDAAAAYVTSNGIESGYVLGGSGALSDETVVSVFALKNAEEIIEK